MAGNDSPLEPAMTLRSCRPACVQCNKITERDSAAQQIDQRR
jgi:hypothetical protein